VYNNNRDIIEEW